MTATARNVDTASTQALHDTMGLAGHPRGLSTLFLTEMWERFSFYGLRAILVLYMVTGTDAGGLGFDTPRATAIFGTYLMAAYLLSLPGGVIADRWLGPHRAVLIGGLIIASGHFAMAVPAMPTFYVGLTLIACGTGLLKPNVGILVGRLYPNDDTRRDSGFSLFYMGINVGAFLAPLVCGYLAEAAGFKSALRAVGIAPIYCWRFGFAAAGIGMLIGLLTFWTQRARLGVPYRKPTQSPLHRSPRHGRTARRIAVYAALASIAAIGAWRAGSHWQAALPLLLAFDALVLVIVTGFEERLAITEWKQMGVMAVCFLASTAFWCAYEQKGASLTLIARDLVSRHVGGFLVPAAWFQSLTALYVILLVPVFAALWAKLGHRQPSTLAKMALAPLIVGIGYAAFALLCASLSAGDKISPLWLAGLYLFDVFGELCLSPVGLSLVTRLAPVRLVGLMMGLWFFGDSFGYKLAGYFAGFYLPLPSRLVWLYGGIAAGLFAVAALLFALLPAMRELVSEKSAEEVVNAR